MAYGLLVALYVLAFPYHPRLRSPNELSRLMQTRALVDFGELSLNRAMRVYGPVGDLSIVDHRYYPSKAPFLSFAAVPIDWTLRSFAGGEIGAVPEIPLVYFSRLLLTVTPTLLSLLLIRRFLAEHVRPEIADAVTLTYALGTLAFSYSLLFMSHQTTAVFLFASFYLAWRTAQLERGRLLLVESGALAALAVTAEYTSALCAGLLAAYVALSARPRGRSGIAIALGWFGLGALPLLLLLAAYHQRVFGGPLETGYRHLADAAYQPWHVGGFLGIRTPDTRALLLSLFSPLRGLLALSPALALGLWGSVLLWRRASTSEALRPLAIFTALLILGYLYFTASFSYESWGWTTGPRHLTGLVPFLLLPLALVLERFVRTRYRGALSGLLLASMLVTGALTFVNYIPDDVSDGVFGLVVPLTATGRLVPSVLNPLGLPNPWAGATLLAIAGVLACFTSWLAIRGVGWRTQVVSAAVVAGAILGVHRVAFQDSPADRGALQLLERDWLAPPGVQWRFWSTDGLR